MSFNLLLLCMPMMHKEAAFMGITTTITVFNIRTDSFSATLSGAML